MLPLALLALVIWLYLLLGRGGYWLFRERLASKMEMNAWPSVVAVVPARDEAESIARAITSLLKQDYPGAFKVILVDDQSMDGTARIAREAAEAIGARAKLEVVTGRERPRGWVGKLWAMKQGVEYASDTDAPDRFLFTDADIEHPPANVSRLVVHATTHNAVLASLMVRLRCDSFAEKLLIPAFVYFFSMLFPFSWSNDPRTKVAAAAGGCMLVERRALGVAGGLDAIKSAIIDDCALARLMKRQGKIWLGLGADTISLRPYEGFADVGRMVWRSAYAQLGYSALALIGTVIGMLLVFGIPAAAAVFGSGLAHLAGAAAWLLMAVSFVPISRFYKTSPLRGILLPVIGLIYTGFTLVSAVNFWRGKGGMWKGRAQAMASS